MIPGEQGYDILNVFGELDSLHFIDENNGESETNRKYGNYIKRCNEQITKL